MDENENKENEKEVVPAWATRLQESLDSLANRLSPEPTESDPNEPQEIPLPQIPEQEQPTPEPMEQEQEPEKPKKRKLLDWLL